MLKALFWILKEVKWCPFSLSSEEGKAIRLCFIWICTTEDELCSTACLQQMSADIQWSCRRCHRAEMFPYGGRSLWRRASPALKSQRTNRKETNGGMNGRFNADSYRPFFFLFPITLWSALHGLKGSSPGCIWQRRAGKTSATRKRNVLQIQISEQLLLCFPMHGPHPMPPLMVTMQQGKVSVFLPDLPSSFVSCIHPYLPFMLEEEEMPWAELIKCF